MQYYSADLLKKLGMRLYYTLGSPNEEAEILINNLVESSLMGIDSHGIIRLTQYAVEMQMGHICPGAESRIIKETPISILIDVNHNFGCVGAYRICDVVANKASSSGFCIGSSLHCGHVGRLGAFTQYLVEKGFIAFAVSNSCSNGHTVVPWGGREGRLATNPLSYAVPAKNHPIVLDMSTAMIAEGKIRALMHEGKPIPEGCILDKNGLPTTDPKSFYGDSSSKPEGKTLPFGSALGYKGFALGLLVELLGASFAGVEVRSDGQEDYLNGFTVAALRRDLMTSNTTFDHCLEALCTHITSCPAAPGYTEVVMPGEYDFRSRETRLANGIPVAEGTIKEWKYFFNLNGIPYKDILGE